MTILLFSLLERFAVYDNEEGCARQQLKICSVICITFFVNTDKRGCVISLWRTLFYVIYCIILEVS